MTYLLLYDVVDHYADRRVPFRAAHLAYSNEAVARGELLLGGALADPVTGSSGKRPPVDMAVLLFRAPSKDVVERFAVHDPYVQNGLVKSWRVREWTTVVGREEWVNPR